MDDRAMKETRKEVSEILREAEALKELETLEGLYWRYHVDLLKGFPENQRRKTHEKLFNGIRQTQKQCIERIRS